jgi:GT2 family glycosyltransferase
MNEPRTAVSLLMPNRNNERILDHILERLAANTSYPNVELVVVDDGSTDSSRQILRGWRDSGRFPRMQLLEREHGPGGVVDALNAGLAEASGELVVQLDADASIETPGWLERMVAYFCSDERIGVITGKIVFDWGEIHTCGVDLIGPTGFHDRGAVITEPVGRRTYHQRVTRFREGECATCEKIAEVDGGIGCCMMYRREVAVGLGGYDPGFSPVWFDDLDLTLGLRRAGLKVFFVPDIRVVHHVGHRLSGDPGPQRAARAVRRRIGSMLPPHARRRISQALGIDRPPRWVWERLLHHYAYWRQKWGYDILNPDMDEVRRLWGATEICWQSNPEMHAAGQEIVAGLRRISAADPAVRGAPLR